MNKVLVLFPLPESGSRLANPAHLKCGGVVWIFLVKIYKLDPWTEKPAQFHIYILRRSLHLLKLFILYDKKMKGTDPFFIFLNLWVVYWHKTGRRVVSTLLRCYDL